MKCLIQIDETGNTIGHPIVINNFLMTFPDADLSGNTAPEGFTWFTRKNHSPQKYSKTKKQVVETQYIKSADGVNHEDNHVIRDMTDDELNPIHENYETNIPFPSWTYDRDTMNYVPPVPKPRVFIGYHDYEWDEESKTWKEIKYNANTISQLLKAPSYEELMKIPPPDPNNSTSNTA